MRFFERIKKFFRKHFFNPKWRCLSCGKEIFDGGNFCPDCKEKLPLNDKSICEHCGRELLVPQDYCSTHEPDLCNCWQDNFSDPREFYQARGSVS